MLRLLVIAALLCAASAASASVTRYALVIGHNHGDKDEADLRFAESDAEKVYGVLRDLGGFQPQNMVLLQGQDASAVEEALVSLTARIDSKKKDSVLVIYYSGHSSAKALHLGGSELPFARLEAALDQASATFRLLILDSCRSGAVTRVKGGKTVDPFQVVLGESVASKGSVYLTSSAASEDAQESDQLKGSFFTHYLVSALMGAADNNGDGRIALEEAYEYTYSHTIRASSRSLGGVQHPTFRYDLRGKGELILTQPGQNDRRRGTLVFPEGRSYLLFAGKSSGMVVGEVGPLDQTRQLNVKAGTYHVVARGRDHLLEGTVEVDAGVRKEVKDSDLERYSYARLVRKGGTDVTVAHGLEAGYRLRTAIVDHVSFCHGVFAGYAAAFSELSLGFRLHGCRSSFDNEFLGGTADEFGGEIRAIRYWDADALSIGLGVAAGGDMLMQRFESASSAPSRTSVAGHAGFLTAIGLSVGGGFAVGVDAMGATYLFQQEDQNGKSGFSARFALVGSLRLGKEW